jgi:uncharacterized membrane protein
MNTAIFTDTVALGAITGMRSLSGPTALAFRHGGSWRSILAALAAGELVMDKTSVVGNRTDTVPLLGRAAMGALAGGVIARDERSSLVAGAVVGAAAAVLMAHLAFRLRKRLPDTVAGGLVEDAVVLAAGSLYATRRRRSRLARPS